MKEYTHTFLRRNIHFILIVNKSTVITDFEDIDNYYYEEVCNHVDNEEIFIHRL